MFTILGAIVSLMYSEGDPASKTTKDTDKDTDKDTALNEKMIPESEMQRLIEAERQRIRDEVTQSITQQYANKVIPDEILQSTDLSHEELINLVKEAISSDAESDENAETEEMKALRLQYEKEIETREREIEAQAAKEQELAEALRTERIDRAIENELLKRGARSPDLITLKLKRFVILNDSNQPVVVNEKGEPRIKTEEEIKDGTRRFNTVDMTIRDLVDEFLDKEENQHFLPASQKGGSGISPRQPLDKNVASEAEYQEALNRARETGNMGDFLKQWQKKYHKVA